MKPELVKIYGKNDYLSSPCSQLHHANSQDEDNAKHHP